MFLYGPVIVGCDRDGGPDQPNDGAPVLGDQFEGCSGLGSGGTPHSDGDAIVPGETNTGGGAVV